MRTIALPVNLLSEGSRQKISDFEPWLLRSGKAYQTIRSYLYAARQPMDDTLYFGYIGMHIYCN